jgi:hypothetical protein
MSPPKSPKNLALTPADAVMAVFGIPIPSITQKEIAKDAIAGVSCALSMGTQSAIAQSAMAATGAS